MKRTTFTLLPIFFLAACSNLQNKTPSKEIDKTNNIIVKTVNVGRGEVVKLNLKSENRVSAAMLQCSDQTIPIEYKNNGEYSAYYSVNYFSTLSTLQCALLDDDGLSYPAFNININDVDYPEETLTVDNKRVTLSDVDQKRADKERALLSAIYEEKTAQALFSTPFMQPLKSKITSEYGTKRVFNQSLKTQHLGTDFRAANGTEIPAANAGKVVFSGELFYTGNTVIINHGLGVFTRYAHLSKSLVKTGDNVKQGEKIALSGQTGRVTAPHLHWDLVVHGNYVNGLKFVNSNKTL